MLKIKKENVDVDKSNKMFTADFINAPVFKKAKPIFLKAKKDKYIQPNP